MKKEVIQILTPEEKAKHIQFIAETIENARHLNKLGAKSVSNPLPGSEMLYGVYKAKLINRRIYEALLRVVEDSTLEYDIQI